jgi:O-antigen ligase
MTELLNDGPSSGQAAMKPSASLADGAELPATHRRQRSEEPQQRGRSNTVAAWILFAAIAGAPLPFGSNDPLTATFWCLWLGVGLIFVSPQHLRRPHVATLAVIAVIVVAFLFVLHEQLANHPWVASPHPIWGMASHLLGKPIPASVSIVRDEPLYALGLPLACLLALTLGVVVGADRQRARQGLQVAAWAGSAYAVYGILSLLLEPTMILWREKTVYVGNLTATFINRNTAATYFGSVAAVWLVLLMQSVRARLPRGPINLRKAHRYLLTNTPFSLIINFVMFFICLAALFMTSSRAGVLTSLIILLVSIFLFFRRDLPRGKVFFIGLIAVAVIGVVVLEIMGGHLARRLESGGMPDRHLAYYSTLRIIADHPWFGTGLGTFLWAFPAYRDPGISLSGIWDLAHSTPLELAAELGIPFSAMIVLAWAAALFFLARTLRGSRRNSAIPLAALTVSVIALLHSSVDFSLQITGYAIVALALVGIGLAQSFPDESAEAASRPQRRRSRAVMENETPKSNSDSRVDPSRNPGGMWRSA